MIFIVIVIALYYTFFNDYNSNNMNMHILKFSATAGKATPDHYASLTQSTDGNIVHLMKLLMVACCRGLAICLDGQIYHLFFFL